MFGLMLGGAKFGHSDKGWKGTSWSHTEKGHDRDHETGGGHDGPGQGHDIGKGFGHACDDGFTLADNLVTAFLKLKEISHWLVDCLKDDDGGPVPDDNTCPTGDPMGEEQFGGSDDGDFLESTPGFASTIAGNEGDDLIYGDDYNDFLLGNPGNDTLFGDCGDDTLFGGSQDDELNGGPGNDFLAGDSGADTLTGGSGADEFHFNKFTARDGALDVITDFDPDDDIVTFLNVQSSDVAFQQAGDDVTILVDGMAEILVQNIEVAALEINYVYT